MTKLYSWRNAWQMATSKRPTRGSSHSAVKRDLDSWLAHHGYEKPQHPYAMSSRPAPATGHARIIHQEPTGRAVFAKHERDHHITTSGRRALKPSQFALPPRPEEKRRGIKGRLPIDTIERARNAIARAAQMKKSGHLSARQLVTVRRKVHAAWPSIESASR